MFWNQQCMAYANTNRSIIKKDFQSMSIKPEFVWYRCHKDVTPITYNVC